MNRAYSLPHEGIPEVHSGRSLIELIQQHEAQLPFAEREIRRHTLLVSELELQQQQADQALNAWRAAVAVRWRCEVEAQRVYTAVWQRFEAAYEQNASVKRLLAMAPPGSAITATDLLSDLRRLHGALSLLNPAPAFASSAFAELMAAGERLERAIQQTEDLEADRRNAIAAQRITAGLYQRAYEETRQLITPYIGDLLRPFTSAA